jgi:hypothetical protein
MIYDYKESRESLFYIEMVVKNIRKQTVRYLQKFGTHYPTIFNAHFCRHGNDNDIERIALTPYHHETALQKAEPENSIPFPWIT